jgi:hypothetical protein
MISKSRIIHFLKEKILFTFLFIFLFPFSCLSINPLQKYKLEKGVPYTYLKNILCNDVYNTNYYQIVHQKKMPWRETLLVISLMTPRQSLSDFSYVMNNVDWIAASFTFLKKLEDIQLFQASNLETNNAISVDEVRGCSFFKKNLFGSFVMGVTKQIPFFLLVSCMESSQSPGHYIYKYAFSNAYEGTNKSDSRIMIVEVANDQVEKVKSLETLFLPKKLSFLLALVTMQYTQKLNMGKFLDILGAPIHWEIFTDNRLRVTYADEKRCKHKSQRIAIIAHFDSQLILSSVDIMALNICAICRKFTKSPYLFEQSRYEKMAAAVSALNFTGNIDYFYEYSSYLQWELDAEINLESIHEIGSTISQEWAMELVKHLYLYGLANKIYDSQEENDNLSFYLELTNNFLHSGNNVLKNDNSLDNISNIKLEYVIRGMNCKNNKDEDALLEQGKKIAQEGKK